MTGKARFFTLIFSFVALFSFAGGNKEVSHENKAEEFNPVEMIMHHIADAHEWHIFGDVSVPLPVILWTENGLTMFMSSAFHHDDAGMKVHEANGQKFVKVHEKIYYASDVANSEGAFIEMDEHHHPANAKPLDFSITKNVFFTIIAIVILFLVFTKVARSYKSNGGVPRGITGFMEPLILFVRDDIAKPNIGHTYGKFMPFLLTIFFFIWILNLIGLVPFIGNPNVSGNIAFTIVLAVFTMIVVNINGNKNYWGHIFNPPVPLALKPLMIPIEFVGVFLKPITLMIRLFANITAGHIIVLSLVSLIFIANNSGGAGLAYGVSPGAVALTLFISVLELLVAALQAYIFTLLTALYIGMAVEEHH